jgi:transcriptional regulator with XRE-family HTH domain
VGIVDDQLLGAALRAVRIRRGLTQSAVARAAGRSQATISRAERGHLSDLSVATLRQIAAGLDIRVDLVPRWRAGELDRLLGARHSAMHERLARLFGELPDWEHAAEVSFSIYGERGAIDILAWQPARRALLVVELKTEIIDVQGLLAQVDRYRRLAPSIARARGWDASTVSCWVVVADSRTNRRRLAEHALVLRGAFPVDGRSIRRWLRDPRGLIEAMSFVTYNDPRNARRDIAARQRVSQSTGRRG